LRNEHVDRLFVGQMGVELSIHLPASARFKPVSRTPFGREQNKLQSNMARFDKKQKYPARLKPANAGFRVSVPSYSH
jgi:hypothetical protein